MKRLKQNDIPQYRKILLDKQHGKCGITGLPIKSPVLDHDHSSGHVRAVLEREINSFEGKVVNAYRRFGRHLGVPIGELLTGLLRYWDRDYSNMPLHPKHKTPEDKLRSLYKKKIRTLKTKKGRDKYRALLDELS